MYVPQYLYTHSCNYFSKCNDKNYDGLKKLLIKYTDVTITWHRSVVRVRELNPQDQIVDLDI